MLPEIILIIVISKIKDLSKPTYVLYHRTYHLCGISLLLNFLQFAEFVVAFDELTGLAL